MKSIIHRLERIIAVFRKASTRGYQKSTLIIKLKETELRRAFLDLVNRRAIRTNDAEKNTTVFEKNWYVFTF